MRKRLTGSRVLDRHESGVSKKAANTAESVLLFGDSRINEVIRDVDKFRKMFFLAADAVDKAAKRGNGDVEDDAKKLLKPVWKELEDIHTEIGDVLRIMRGVL